MPAAAARPKRKDPTPRPIVDGGGRHTRLANTDPDRHYVGVSRFSRQGVEFYRSLGYRVEKHHPDGVRFRNGAQTSEQGGEVSMRELTLMSISKEDKLKLDKYGWDGSGGTSLRDRREEQLLSRDGGTMNPFNGKRPNPNHFGFENETTPGVPVG